MPRGVRMYHDQTTRATAFNKSTELHRSGQIVELRGEDIHEVVTVES